MRAAYEAFRDGLGAGSIAAAAGPDPDAGPAFYAWLYAGLYHEAHGAEADARDALLRCVCVRVGSLWSRVAWGRAKGLLHHAREPWPRAPRAPPKLSTPLCRALQGGGHAVRAAVG